MVGRMPRWWAIALVAGLLAGGCEESDDGGAGEGPPEREMVRVELDLPRPEAGAPDAGTQAGHGGDRYLLRAAGADPIISGRVVPAAAPIELADASGTRVARVNVARDGRFSALLPRLPRTGAVSFRLTAGAGRTEPRRTEILASRKSAASAPESVRVPEADRTPPAAGLLLRSSERVVSSVAPVWADRDAPLGLDRPTLALTAITRDEDGGTGRVRVSVEYVRTCGGEVVRRKLHFPPSEIGRDRLAPGARAPASAPPGERPARGRRQRLHRARQGLGRRHERLGTRELQRPDPLRVLALAEEVPERSEQLGGRLLGDEVATRHLGRRHIAGPPAPDLGRVGELPLFLPRDEQQRRFDAPAALRSSAS